MATQHDTFTYEEFLEFLAESSTEHDGSNSNGLYGSNSNVNGEEWHGTNTFRQAMKLARGGWPEGLERFTQMELEGETAATGERPAFYTDVVGARPIVPLVLSGIPQNMLAVTTQPANRKRVARIVAYMGARGDVSGDELMRHGLAIGSLIDQMESDGISTEVLYRWEAMHAGTPTGKRDRSRLDIKVKTQGQPLDRDLLAFVSAQPAMFRRLVFRWREQYFDKTLPSRNWGGTIKDAKADPDPNTLTIFNCQQNRGPATAQQLETLYAERFQPEEV